MFSWPWDPGIPLLETRPLEMGDSCKEVSGRVIKREKWKLPQMQSRQEVFFSI